MTAFVIGPNDMHIDTNTTRLRFQLPPQLEAREPPEARGLGRDSVRLLVACKSSGELTDTTFSQLPEYSRPAISSSSTPRGPPLMKHRQALSEGLPARRRHQVGYLLLPN